MHRHYAAQKTGGMQPACDSLNRRATAAHHCHPDEREFKLRHYRILLALDGVKFLRGRCPCDRVDTRVAAIETLRLGSFGIHPDAIIKIAIRCLVAQIRMNELFEIGHFFAL